MAVMNRMRENTKTILMILVVAFILTIIIDWGMGGFKTSQPQGVIASVNGDEIMYEEFYQAYQDELRMHRERTGAEAEGYQLQQIENQVFERLVQQRLLSQVIEDIELKATDEEVLEEIKNNPPEFLRQNEAFLDSNGVFQMSKYQAALMNPQANWAPVEQYVRATLPVKKLDELLRASVVVTDDEARLEYMKSNAKRKVNYILYDASRYTGSEPEPGEAELDAFYEDHKEEYREPEKRVLEYVLIETSPTAADTQATFQQAEELLQDARRGEDFAQLARIHSQDPSAENGGDLGYFGEGAMVQPFEQAAFAAGEGEIVGPVQTQFGVHLIKVEDRKREDGELQVKARHILLKFEVSPQTRESMLDEASYIAEYAKESDLATVAAAENFTLQTSQPFEKEGFIPGLGLEPKVSRFAFRSKQGDVSSVLYLDRGFLIASLAQIMPEHIKPLDEMRDTIVAQLKAEKRMQLALEQCRAALGRIEAGATIDEVASEDSLEVQVSDLFTLSGYVTGVGREPRFVGAAFGLDIGDYSQPVEGTRGYYLMQVVDAVEFDESAFQNQKESLKAQLLQRKRGAVFGLWYSALKERSRIKDYRGQYL